MLIPYWWGSLTPWVWPLIGIGALLSYWPGSRWVSVGLLGLLYSSYQVDHSLALRLGACDSKLRVVANVQIDGLVRSASGSHRFTGKVTRVITQAQRPSRCRLHQGHRLRLSWRLQNPKPPQGKPPPGNSPQSLQPGAVWQVPLVLTSPRGPQNPGGFDYERWHLSERVSATGYVTGNLSNPMDAAAHGPRLVQVAPSTLRQRLRSGLHAQLQPLVHGAQLQALVLGDTSGFTAEFWQQLRATGTMHLFVVSGLHVGLVAALGFTGGRLCCFLWMSLGRRFAVSRVSALCAGICAASYVWIAGIQVSTLRALMMVCFGLAAMSLGRRLSVWVVFWLAFIGVLLVLPQSGWDQGFYLSFGSVALLLLFFEPRVRPRRRTFSSGLVHLLQAQFVLVLGHWPLAAANSHAVAPLGPAANLIAVPLIAFVVVPLGFLASLVGQMQTLGQPLWQVVNAAAGTFSALLTLAPALPLWWLAQPLALPTLAVWCGGALLLLPGPRWLMLLGAAGWTLLFCSPQADPAAGHFKITAFDVGQGSAVLIQTQHRRLLFDTGPAFESGFNQAQAVVLPSLGAMGIRSLDKLIVSHGDTDHAGGLESMLRGIPVAQVMLGAGVQTPTRVAKATVSCKANSHWQWDQVDFRILHPQQPDAWRDSRNDGSCVLLVSNDTHSALLGGDISARVESTVARALPSPVTLMMAPHHGSKTSSSLALIRRAQPVHVWVSAPHFSRYGHPHPQVVQRYCEHGAQLAITGHQGALQWNSAQPNGRRQWRQRAPFWVWPPVTGASLLTRGQDHGQSHGQNSGPIDYCTTAN